MDTTSQLLEPIYRAAVDPEAWSQVTVGLQRQYRCRATGIYDAEPVRRRVSVISVQGITSGMVGEYVDRFLVDNPWRAVPALQRPGVIRSEVSLDRHYRVRGYFRGTALYNEWMKPQYFEHTLGVDVHGEDGISTKLFLYRDTAAGPFQAAEIRQLRGLYGHLRTAVRVSRRLAAQSAGMRQAAGLMDTLNFGLLFLDNRGSLLQANRFAEALLAACDGLQSRGQRLQACHRGDQRPLETAIRAALDAHLGLCRDAPRPVNLRRPGSAQALRITATPLPRQADDRFLLRRAAVMLMVIDPGLEADVPGDWLTRRYALTPAEVRLVQALVRGASLRKAAEASGLTYETARSYLKIVFQKTGTARQAELVSTLLRERAGSSGSGDDSCELC